MELNKLFGKTGISSISNLKTLRRDTLIRQEPKREFFMRIQFTHENKTYALETIASFAKHLAQRFAKTQKPIQTEFVADFVLISYDYDCEITIPKVLSDIREIGWCGVKEFGEIGLNSDNRQLAFDYYVGSHSRVFDYNKGSMNEKDAARLIKDVLQDVLDVSYDTPLLLVQWTQDECLKKDEREAVKPIENAAVTNFAEMLCDYVSGLDEGEGIGREDIIDHLYEYINWDKRFTREYEEGKKNFKPF